MNKKWFLSLIIAALVALLAACGDGDESAEDNNDESETQEEESADNEAAPEGGEGGEQPQMPEPDMEGVPDVVAEVNGEEIAKEEFENTYTTRFQQATMQSQMSGQEVDEDQLKQQVADSMIGMELLIQEADNSGVEASEEDINTTLDELVEMNGLESKDDFLTAMEEQGMGEEEVMSQVELQAKIDKLIASETGDIEPSEEELQEMYDQLVAQQEQQGGEGEGSEEAEIPSFDELKPDLEKQLISQEEGKAVQTLVENLREDADVTVHL
ncbi:SurA N-terminal domain-containing protein [Virgibacillus ainsalahensis]